MLFQPHIPAMYDFKEDEFQEDNEKEIIVIKTGNY